MAHRGVRFGVLGRGRDACTSGYRAHTGELEERAAGQLFHSFIKNLFLTTQNIQYSSSKSTMAPSYTVENYLKAIFQAQIALADSDALVPMGQLASAIGVVPGTATTMVKTLAESGLARYEAYAGVRLTAAGEKLAALVLRRHRLVELFLVQVMGMSWTEVHEEAEHLEHAVSDRLIERIDAMLGRPAVDPHGDPIPDPDGSVRMPAYESLLTCPIDVPVTISRVSDQDRAFLEFAERHGLRPGDVVRVEERNTAGDSVRLRGRNDRRVTIGARAASKVLVQAHA